MGVRGAAIATVTAQFISCIWIVHFLSSEKSGIRIFLASSAASYMTATTIEVSGGRSMTLNPSFAYDRLAAAENR